ncbi:hypothetical protein TSOC_000273 [Tetrabaena socialis]|uniref:Uncharacterized protein n=1 Tax=Tetrabaena socialis TaxID=47790 RepID=A0A2J8AJU8_9CHLO|nr:hypothetical protein TSOC_000273 [Tetrabaena socialis]|eukprot:PNH12788.1 hypothetical protein TSOC_000273 [Tetrabaena socialis]
MAPASGRASLIGGTLPLSALPVQRRPSSNRTCTNTGDEPSDSDGPSGNETEGGALFALSSKPGSARFRGLRASAEPAMVIAKRQTVTINGVGSVSTAIGLAQHPQQPQGMRGCARPLSASAVVRSQSSLSVTGQGAPTAFGAASKSRAAKDPSTNG